MPSIKRHVVFVFQAARAAAEMSSCQYRRAQLRGPVHTKVYTYSTAPTETAEAAVAAAPATTLRLTLNVKMDD